MRDASEMCVQKPVEKRIPKAIAERKPCNSEIYARRNLAENENEKKVFILHKK
jgi:hypothetical protein